MEQLAGALFYTPAGPVQFKGKSFDQEYALPIFASAWMGVAVGEATEGNCGGQDDFHTVDGCAMHDICGDSRSAFMLADVKS